MGGQVSGVNDDVETWKAIPGWEELYEVSDQGRVRSKDRVVYAHYSPTFEYAGRRRRGKILRASLNPKGYPMVTLGRNVNERSPRTVHALVMLTFVGPRPVGKEVRHLNGDSRDARLSNLAYGTHSENMRDCIAHGTNPLARKERCKRGHPLSGDNLYVPANGSRQCRTCCRERSQAYEASGKRVRKARAS